MKITPTCFIGLLLAVQGNLHAQNRLPGNCLDTLAVREMYRDGHVREALHTWENFMAEGARSEIRISRECFLLAEQYMGGLKLVLNKDTATAETYFASLLQLAPNQEMWEFDLPMETQTFWDHFREENGKGLPFDETWKNNWMPPLKYETPKNNVLLKLRKVYHQNRRLFAVSGDDRFKIILLLDCIPLRSLRLCENLSESGLGEAKRFASACVNLHRLCRL